MNSFIKKYFSSGRNMCIPIQSKVATCTNFPEYFSTGKTEKGHENFRSFNHNCRSRNLRTVDIYICVCGFETFFFTITYISYGREINFETNLACSRVESRASRTMFSRYKERVGQKRWSQGNATRRRLRAPEGRIKWGEKKRGS